MKKRKKRNQRPKGLDLLSTKEMRVLVLFGKGYSNQEIATRFHNSRKTIETHKERAAKKLGINPSTYRKLAFKVAAGII